ncbi:hypothetical protein [Deinococcus aerophilus]|uniref:Uncharacterized protein n=1 Tax=Deinococcus aerophilus TaxID=522488 RepID=A0ABQ2GJ56_9DEIO|nr:hypothetical protein [Deinococcus aerophilus]GGL99021.1 hypothetical protein GCM10010841_04420 [Deinococcus aerophilus]
MTSDSRRPQDSGETEQERGEIVQTTVPELDSDAVNIPEGDPHNETPTERAARLQRQRTSGIIPDNEDG